MTARSIAQDAELALLLEVTGTPKPGNVDRNHDHDDLRFEHFMAGAVGARPGLERAADGERVGRVFERAVAGMVEQSAGNTQFGALLLLAPLVAAAHDAALTPTGTDEVVRATTVADAAEFYRSFEHVDVAVGDPPSGLEPLDVRRGSAAIPAIEERALTLYDVMERSADVDGVAAEWVSGFERVFGAAERIIDGDDPVPDRAATVFLELLAEEPDTFVVKQSDRETAETVQQRAQAVLDGQESAAELADEFLDRGINPGTTADLVAGALFVALRRGVEV
ncbi:triphosphoribosyl-dephospho-CoA synthase [Haloarcula montana]|uniref:triphosphoribosyl-dephospho-CoA synthase n=1 Tax=Haloarcula montana TaxID=3111776 RepID=UPI002D79F125|nr:triphosphoribosyl-dephospho-CoA synthase [Haloarcula sp. GH36]